MTSDLDKYGLVALTVIIVLILFIAISDLQSDSDPGLQSIMFEDNASAEDGTDEDDGAVVVVGTEEDAQISEDFDFMEPPVDVTEPLSGPRAQATVEDETFKIHKVRKGEILSTISRRYYGKSSYWKRISSANPGVNPNRLTVGQQLRIPDLALQTEGSERAPERSHAAAADGMRTSHYRVKKGDTLGKIAKRFYGNEGQWRKIKAANRSLIPDTKKLKIGIVLEIPR